MAGRAGASFTLTLANACIASRGEVRSCQVQVVLCLPLKSLTSNPPSHSLSNMAGFVLLSPSSRRLTLLLHIPLL
jgi:hypothetical protein